MKMDSLRAETALRAKGREEEGKAEHERWADLWGAKRAKEKRR
jgi:hypothetical protein